MMCLFCELAEPRQTGHSMPEDRILAISTSFYAKPALGHFVDGYLLLITKRHYKTLAEIPSEDFTEFEQFKDRLSRILSRLYKSPILAFEHGCTNPERRAGSCIDHAHLHLLPFPTDLAAFLKDRFPVEPLTSSAQLTRYSSSGTSYLYYEFQPGEKLAFQVQADIPGQYLRRIVCERLGVPDVWDWAAYPFRDRIRAFAKAYASATRRSALRSGSLGSYRSDQIFMTGA